MSRPACLALATISLLVISNAAAHAQALAPSTLRLTGPEQETKTGAVQVITKEPAKAITKKPALVFAMERRSESIRPITHYSYRTPEGKKESASVITHYYPKQIVYPFAKVDRHIDGKLMRAATIAQERAHAHSRSMCWHYVKEALLAS